MHARIVRFNEVSPERIAEMVEELEGREGPPPGVDARGMQLFYDSDQRLAVFVGQFDDEDKMRAADEALNQMDGSRTPGSRVSVDLCELKLERTAGE